MYEKEWEGRGVRGEETVARECGFGNEERDGWRFFLLQVRVRFGVRCGRRGGGRISVYDALELAQVAGAHLPLFGFALGEDAQAAPVCYVAAHGLLYCSVERI
jgi:hypothetical protein